MKIRELLSVKLAGLIMLVGLSFLALFHMLVLSKILPSSIVWAGQVEDSASNFTLMEVIALVLTFLFIVIVVIQSGHIQKSKLNKIASYSIWIVFIYFVWNVFANLLSDNFTEKLIFIPLSIVLALLALRLALKKQEQVN